MSTATDITIQNGAATPANVTFKVTEASPSRSLFEDRSAGVLAFFRSLLLRTRRPSKTDPNTRVNFVVRVPVTEVIDGKTVLAHVLEADVRIKLPDGSSDASRDDLFAFTVNGLNHALIKNVIKDYDFIN